MNLQDQEYYQALGESSPLEGQLAVDVLETETEIIIRSAVAGVEVEDLDIAVTPDTVTIRGERETCGESSVGITHIEECYWGKFSRSVVLPHPVDPNETDAVLQNGILTITLTKAQMDQKISVRENS